MSASTVRWYTNETVGDAVAEARATGRPLLVDFWDPKCLGCAKLLAVTYPDPAVEALLARSFVCVKYNEKQVNEWFRKLSGTVAHLWTPDLLVLDDRLTQVRRFSGYAPPGEFAAQLRIGLGLWHLQRRRSPAALDCFAAVAAQLESEAAAAEALYWAGGAAYGVGGLAELRPWWERLQEQHPASDWAQHADCLDVVIPAEGFRSDDPSSVRVGSARVGSATRGVAGGAAPGATAPRAVDGNAAAGTATGAGPTYVAP
jgi:hypothetical protein